MCAYTGFNDPSRDYPEDLDLDGLLVIMPAYTTVVPVCMDEGLLPFTAENQAPAVSTRCLALISFSPSTFCPLMVFCSFFAKI